MVFSSRQRKRIVLQSGGREKKREIGNDEELLNIERVGFVRTKKKQSTEVGTSEQSQHGFEHEKKRKDNSGGNHNISRASLGCR